MIHTPGYTNLQVVEGELNNNRKNNNDNNKNKATIGRHIDSGG